MPDLDPEVQNTACENLINCWLREGGLYKQDLSNLIQIPLTHQSADSEIQVYFEDQTLLKEIRRIQEVRFQGQPIGPVRLAELLAEEISHTSAHDRTQASRLVPDWRENLESSLFVQNLILQTANPRNGFDFISSEQGLLLGHRFHPSPKSRIGFTEAELRSYSPEFGGSFQLHYFAITNEKAIVRGSNRELSVWRNRMDRTIADKLSHLPHSFESFILLPVHPWQARRVLQAQESSLYEYLKNGQAYDLGKGGPYFHPTASVRTLYQAEWDIFIKTSLDVRITNCFRRNLAVELDASEFMGGMVEKFLQGKNRETPRFRILREPLSVDLQEEKPSYLGAIFREGLQPEFSDGIQPVLGAWLFGDGEFSVHRAKELFSSVPAVLNWFSQYVQLVIAPHLEIFFEYGIMFEPHLQNVLIGIKNLQPVRLILRDLDNAKVIEGSVAYQAAHHLDEEAAKEACYPLDFGWKRLIYCMIINNLSEAISTLARVASTFQGKTHDTEQKLWDVLADELYRFYRYPLVKELLKNKKAWAKRNLFSRFTRTADRWAPFAEVSLPFEGQR